MAVLRLGVLPLAVALAGSGVLAGCARRPPVPLRPEPVPYADTLPILEPAYREPDEVPIIVEDAVSGQITRGISLRRAVGESHEALNVTRHDDVVSSAWFEHRNGRRRLAPEEVFRGPTSDGGPDTSGPLILTQAKLQGISPGFHLEDASGRRFVVKFDPKGFQHLSSSAGVIANRLLYAAGYHVPEDYIFRFRRDQITGVAEDATYQDEEFVEHPLGLDLVDEILSRVDTLPDGRFLAVASQYVPGPPKGPFRFSGTRDDDPNDWYPHEHRRDLRGLYVVSSWVNHVDMRFANTMDAFVEPGYLRHYLIDFAASLGSGTIRPHYPREGAEYNFDLWSTMGRLVTLGFYRVGWEDEPYRDIDPSIGWMQVETFDPARWKANWPNDAFVNMTPRDAYWGAKLVGSFDDEQIRAAVRAGELPRDFAADTLTDMLIYRRDRIVAYWYGQVSPVESPAVEPGAPGPGFELWFEDYGVRDGVWEADDVTYEWEMRHEARAIRWKGAEGATPGTHRQRLRVRPAPGQAGPDLGSPVASADDAIAVLTIKTVVRGRDDMPGRKATVFLLWDAEEEKYRVAGLEH